MCTSVYVCVCFSQWSTLKTIVHYIYIFHVRYLFCLCIPQLYIISLSSDKSVVIDKFSFFYGMLICVLIVPLRNTSSWLQYIRFPFFTVTARKGVTWPWTCSCSLISNKEVQWCILLSYRRCSVCSFSIIVFLYHKLSISPILFILFFFFFLYSFVDILVKIMIMVILGIECLCKIFAIISDVSDGLLQIRYSM